MFNNNIGTIYVERVDATNSSGTLTYTTGISGTQGKANDDGTINDTQNIVVNTNSATLNINGAGGVDKFNIEASSFTKTLTIAGNLGTVPNYEEANNNYDTVRIDLSKTSGVNLDISRLLVSNPNDDGIQIVASKGADNITLVAGANHDVIEFTAGGGKTAAQETYEVDLGNLRLGKNQSFTIDGVTITNIASDATVLTVEQIAEALTLYVGAFATSTGTAAGLHGSVTAAVEAWSLGAAKIATSGGSAVATTLVSIEGKFESLTKEWLDASGNVTISTEGTKIILQAPAAAGNATDLEMTWNGGKNADIPADITAELQLARAVSTGKGFAFVGASAAATAAVTAGGTVFEFKGVATGATTTVIININGSNHSIKVANPTGAATAKTFGAAIEAIVTGASSGAEVSGAEIWVDGTKLTSSDASSVANFFGTENADKIHFAFNDDKDKMFAQVIDPLSDFKGTIVFDQVGGTAGATTVTQYANNYIEKIQQGKIVVDFGQGLLAGQSYSFNGKTVVATKDLTGAEVAEAFTFGKGEAFDGAVIIDNFTSTKIDQSNVLFGIDGSKLTILDINASGTPTGIKGAATTDITGTGALAVNTNRVTASTTQQGVGSGEVTFADSYVVFSASELGSAAAGSAAGVAANIKLVTSALDTITNFDVANDKLLLKHLDGSKYVASDRAANVTTATDSKIYVDTAGNTLSYTIANGIVDFSAGNAEASAMTLDQKVYAAWSAVDNTSGKIAGFEHGGDFYVIATGGQSGSSTDDLVIKLAGVTGITDIGAVLA